MAMVPAFFDRFHNYRLFLIAALKRQTDDATREIAAFVRLYSLIAI
jgi:hypothetical protein